MTHDLGEKIDLIAAKYFRVVNVLYTTISFYNVSVAYTLRTKEKVLMDEYVEFEECLKELYTDFKGDFHSEVVKKHMRSMCFINLVSAFEEYLVEMCTLALKKYPHKISGEHVDFKKAIDMSRDELIEYKAKEHLNKIMYMAPKEYLKALCQLLSVDPSSLSETFIKYIEIKARRDLGVHNDWRKNETYERKVKDSGGRIPEDSDILRPSHEYLKYSHAVCQNLVAKITKQSCDNLFKASMAHITPNKIPLLN